MSRKGIGFLLVGLIALSIAFGIPKNADALYYAVSQINTDSIEIVINAQGEDSRYLTSLGLNTGVLAEDKDIFFDSFTSLSGDWFTMMVTDLVNGVEYVCIGAAAFNNDIALTGNESETFRLSLADGINGTDYAIAMWSAYIMGNNFDTSEQMPIIGLDFYNNLRSGDTLSVAPVPEPSTMLLLGAGLVSLVGTRRKIKK